MDNNKLIGISPLYKDIGEIIEIKNYKIVNPYNTKLYENFDLLLISKGYENKVKKINNYPIFEIKSATFKDLINSIKQLEKLGIGNKNKIKNYINKIIVEENKIKSINYNKNINIITNTEFLKKILTDLNLKIENTNNYNNNSILIIPDYLDKNNNKDNSKNNNKNKIIINTHNYNLNTLDRIKNRYLQIINHLNKV